MKLYTDEFQCPTVVFIMDHPYNDVTQFSTILDTPPPIVMIFSLTASVLSSQNNRYPLLPKALTIYMNNLLIKTRNNLR